MIWPMNVDLQIKNLHPNRAWYKYIIRISIYEKKKKQGHANAKKMYPDIYFIIFFA